MPLLIVLIVTAVHVGMRAYGIRELPGCSRDATQFVSRIASR